jgi:hypothetical protein
MAKEGRDKIESKCRQYRKRSKKWALPVWKKKYRIRVVATFHPITKMFAVATTIIILSVILTHVIVVQELSRMCLYCRAEGLWNKI